MAPSARSHRVVEAVLALRAVTEAGIAASRPTAARAAVLVYCIQRAAIGFPSESRQAAKQPEEESGMADEYLGRRRRADAVRDGRGAPR
jgi:hypothetical protein